MSVDPPAVLRGPRLDLVLLTAEQLLSRDGVADPVPLPYADPHDALDPEHSPVLRRIAQVRADPTELPWLIRLAVLRDTGEIVGLGNFHARPDDDGMVELGYSVLPAYRGRGFGHEIAATLWGWASTHDDVRTLRATVSPDNAASIAIIERAGLLPVGEQWDDEDGLELVYEIPAADYAGP